MQQVPPAEAKLLIFFSHLKFSCTPKLPLSLLELTQTVLMIHTQINRLSASLSNKDLPSLCNSFAEPNPGSPWSLVVWTASFPEAAFLTDPTVGRAAGS